MFRYFARLSEKYDLPVYPIVLLSFDSPRTEQPSSYQVAIANRTILQFNYQVIQLNRLNWRDFMRHENPIATALMAKMRIDKNERWRVKLECLRLLATLKLDPARTKLISGFVDTYLRLNAEEETELRSQMETLESEEREAVMQIVTSWMLEGIEQGIEQEGLKIVMRLLKRRFGEAAVQLEERITQLSIMQLEELAEALLDFGEERDLIVWLQNISVDESSES